MDGASCENAFPPFHILLMAKWHDIKPRLCQVCEAAPGPNLEYMLDFPTQMWTTAMRQHSFLVAGLKELHRIFKYARPESRRDIGAAVVVLNGHTHSRPFQVDLTVIIHPTKLFLPYIYLAGSQRCVALQRSSSNAMQCTIPFSETRRR